MNPQNTKLSFIKGAIQKQLLEIYKKTFFFFFLMVVWLFGRFLFLFFFCFHFQVKGEKIVMEYYTILDTLRASS